MEFWSNYESWEIDIWEIDNDNIFLAHSDNMLVYTQTNTGFYGFVGDPNVFFCSVYNEALFF